MSLQLHQGDCLEILPRMESQSVDVVLADLPYGTTRNAWDSVIPLEPLWAEYLRVCRGPIILTAKSPFDKVLAVSNLKMLRHEWVWEKGNATGFLNAKRAPLQAHELVLVFCKGPVPYFPQMTHGHARKVTKRETVASACYGEGKKRTEYDSTSRYPRSVQFFSSDKQRSNLHPTQKPVALMEYLLQSYSEPGQLILDNCMGSGTTGVAALHLGRSFIGIEKDEAYFQTAQSRLHQGLT